MLTHSLWLGPTKRYTEKRFHESRVDWGLFNLSYLARSRLYSEKFKKKSFDVFFRINSSGGSENHFKTNFFSYKIIGDLIRSQFNIPIKLVQFSTGASQSDLVFIIFFVYNKYYLALSLYRHISLLWLCVLVNSIHPFLLNLISESIHYWRMYYHRVNFSFHWSLKRFFKLIGN